MEILEASSPADVQTAQPEPRSRDLWRNGSWRAAAALLFAVLVICSIAAGLRVRRWAWEATTPIRFTKDVTNGVHWGQDALDNGLIGIYDRVVAESERGQYFLDYTPLRLWIMMRWAAYRKAHYPDAYARGVWLPEYAYTRPLLTLNSACELASAVAAFLLVLLWVRRAGAPSTGLLSQPWARTYHGWGRATLAALLVWFNPAVIINAHSWPQWDVWILPFFLFAALLACVDWWFCAGVLLGIAAMLKGQIMAGVPLLILWPIFSGRFTAAIRLLIGMALTVGVILFPWLASNSAAIRWIILAVAAIAISSAPLMLRRHLREELSGQRRAWRIAVIAAGPALLAILLILWPAAAGGWRWMLLIALGIASLTAAAFLVRPRIWPFWIAGALAAAIWLMAPVCHGSLAPLRLGYEYGAHKFPDMARTCVSNLPAILSLRYGWKLEDPALPIDLDLPLVHVHQVLSIKIVLWSAFGLATLACAFGAAMHARRKDPRFLIALATPWLLFFALMPQMHQRYLMWGAAIAVLAAGVNPGLLLIALFLTAVAWAMQFHALLTAPGQFFKVRFAPKTLSLIQGTNPEIGWAVLLCGLIYLYVAVTPRRRVTD